MKHTYIKPAVSVVVLGGDLCDSGLGLVNASIQTKDGKHVDSMPVVENNPDDEIFDDKSNWGGN